jgi:hypothetical protein
VIGAPSRARRSLGPGVLHLELETHALSIEALRARRLRRVPRVHEGKTGRSRGAGGEQDEPGGLEDDLEAEPAAVEVAAGGQMLGDDDRVETL